MHRKLTYKWWTVMLLSLLLAACAGAAPEPGSSPGMLNVITTTTIVGDVVRSVGGESITLRVLLPVGSDPHSFEPVPQDLARLSDAELIFANGAGLEEFMSRYLESAGGEDKVIFLSDGLDLLEEAGGEHVADEEHLGGDPHVWTDPTLVAAWVERIAQALSERDPSNAAAYQANAAAYQQQLSDLDRWIEGQVANIPLERRKLVTDHETFAYFAKRYGFETVGAVVPGYSTLAEPSAQELAALEDAIRDLGVRAVFVDSTVNPTLAQRVAQDTSTRIVRVYSGSLSEAGGEADSYLEYMRYNTNAIVSALK